MQSTAPVVPGELRAFLSQPLRVSLEQDRTIEGTLICLDRQQNLVVNEAWEVRRGEGGEMQESRCWRGLIMLPGRAIRRVERAAPGSAPPSRAGAFAGDDRSQWAFDDDDFL